MKIPLQNNANWSQQRLDQFNGEIENTWRILQHEHEIIIVRNWENFSKKYSTQLWTELITQSKPAFGDKMIREEIRVNVFVSLAKRHRNDEDLFYYQWRTESLYYYVMTNWSKIMTYLCQKDGNMRWDEWWLMRW